MIPLEPDDPDDLLSAAAPATFIVTDALLARIDDPDMYAALVAGELRFLAIQDDGVHGVDIPAR
jgi:hypothetical protein